jgi:hypothetical protein
MSTLSKFFRGIRGDKRKTTSEPKDVRGIPTVKFDPTRVTEVVKADLKTNILSLPEIDENTFEQVYGAAIRSISAGRDLHLLTNALLGLNIESMTKRRAGEIALLLNNRATALMARERQISLGITHAIWLYSGAPCMLDPRKPADYEIQQNAAHRAVNGKEFEIVKGMYLNGKWTWPGVEPGCKCVSRSKIPGFS